MLDTASRDDELLVTNADDFRSWLEDPLTKASSRCCYFIGHLASAKKSATVRDLAAAALRAAGYRPVRVRGEDRTHLVWDRKQQLVRLFQRRIPEAGFEYLAIRA